MQYYSITERHHIGADICFVSLVPLAKGKRNSYCRKTRHNILVRIGTKILESHARSGDSEKKHCTGVPLKYTTFETVIQVEIETETFQINVSRRLMTKTYKKESTSLLFYHKNCDDYSATPHKPR